MWHYSNRSRHHGSHPPSLLVAHRSRSPTRRLEPNNRELILLFWKLSRRRVPLLRAAAPFHAFIRGADSLPSLSLSLSTNSLSPALFFVSSSDSFPRLFHFVERERERGWPGKRRQGRPCSFKHKSSSCSSSSSSSARTIFNQVLSALPP